MIVEQIDPPSYFTADRTGIESDSEFEPERVREKEFTG
jgi:hypothetical protein